MRNILVLLCVCIAAFVWVSDFLLLGDDNSNKKEANSFNLETSRVSQKQFDIEQLAKTLGVDYQYIGKNKEDVIEPDIIEVTLSLVAIYTSGDMAKARLKVKSPTGEDTINVIKGDKFESLELSKISATEVELLNSGQTVQLKMYKPQVISITKTNGVEEVTK